VQNWYAQEKVVHSQESYAHAHNVVQVAHNHADEDNNYDIAVDIQEFIMEHLQGFNQIQ
jgi:hypothetical protein